MDVSKVISGTNYALLPNRQSQNIETKPEVRNAQTNKNGILQQKTLYTQASTHGNQLVERAEIEVMIEGLNDFLEPINRSIRFELHDKLNRYYVKVIDTKTEEIVREIPPKQMLDMYAAMAEFMGLIIDEKI
ncbi:MAG: flagellar protein FlaG [Amphibacillus sp.]|nr:flagellar protein FlaG [Amphibacillus sp.]